MVPPTPASLGVGPGLRGRSPFRVARVLRGEGRRRSDASERFEDQSMRLLVR